MVPGQLTSSLYYMHSPSKSLSLDSLSTIKHSNFHIILAHHEVSAQPCLYLKNKRVALRVKRSITEGWQIDNNIQQPSDVLWCYQEARLKQEKKIAWSQVAIIFKMDAKSRAEKRLRMRQARRISIVWSMKSMAVNAAVPRQCLCTRWNWETQFVNVFSQRKFSDLLKGF